MRAILLSSLVTQVIIVSTVANIAIAANYKN